MAKRPKKITPLRRRIRYAAGKGLWVLLIASAVAGMIWADRGGLFGRKPITDEQKYHGGSFLVVKVVDGDTLDVDAADGGRSFTRVRLWGVDTPETKKPHTPVQHFGPQAEAFTSSRCLGRTVRLELLPHRTRGKHGRLLAYVWGEDGRMLNRMLVELGYGYADPNYPHTHSRQFARLQNQARQNRLGLWRSVTNADLPWYYKSP